MVRKEIQNDGSKEGAIVYITEGGSSHPDKEVAEEIERIEDELESERIKYLKRINPLRIKKAKLEGLYGIILEDPETGNWLEVDFRNDTETVLESIS